MRRTSSAAATRSPPATARRTSRIADEDELVAADGARSFPSMIRPVPPGVPVAPCRLKRVSCYNQRPAYRARLSGADQPPSGAHDV